MIPSTIDGHPDAWFTASGDVGPAFTSHVHVYPNAQPACTLWYHDHTAGMTRLNVAAGLAGVYLIEDREGEEKLGLNLPLGSQYDIPLMLQDRSVDAVTGVVTFPLVGTSPEVHPSWVPETYGDYIVVNGKVREGKGGTMNCIKPALGRG